MSCCAIADPSLDTLRLRWDGQNFRDDIFKCIFYKQIFSISIKISLKLIPIKNIPALVQIMAWHHPGDKPLSEPVMVNLQMHICITQPQWVTSETARGSECVELVFWMCWIGVLNVLNWCSECIYSLWPSDFVCHSRSCSVLYCLLENSNFSSHLI